MRGERVHAGPAMTCLRAFLGVHQERLRRALRGHDRGASAVELAVITAMILAVALILLGVITHFVTSESKQIHG